ncbi:large ribosomal subunit protein mL55 [Culicoides brevitarsis]|uniref:large ribosomal subunit protein mL55 n=1 Tax=Culicoides brevitarsis TaxID=469753 RepID=UPI00307B1A55
MLIKSLLTPKLPFAEHAVRYLSSTTASVTRLHRHIYARIYPTVVALPDGSTFNIRYHEPRKIIKLPLDLSTLTEAERKARVLKRKPKKKIVVEEELEDTYSAKKYLKYVKK